MKNRKIMSAIVLCLLCLFVLNGCTKKEESKPSEPESTISSFVTDPSTSGEEVSEEKEPTPLEIEDPEISKDQTGEESEEKGPEPNGYLVVIDAGHQSQGNSELEPDGPGSSNMKAKVSGGTSGISTKVPEYKLTLAIAKKLEKELTSRGYDVIMTRKKNDVDISNSERAKIANEAEADAFIRIHADGSGDSGASGIMTICQTSSNPYNGELYKKSKALSEAVLACCVKETEAKDRGVWETDTMSGINWAMVPVTIIEVGFMTNPEEDEKMETDDYQEKLAVGMADGIDKFLKVK